MYSISMLAMAQAGRHLAEPGEIRRDLSFRRKLNRKTTLGKGKMGQVG